MCHKYAYTDMAARVTLVGSIALLHNSCYKSIHFGSSYAMTVMPSDPQLHIHA
jgi:hypothetical protein